MAAKTKNRPHTFEPDFAIPPGDTLKETLSALGMTQAELALRTGRPKKTINEIAQGKARITAETARQFERVLGVPASFWNNLEKNYRATLARIAERERFNGHIEWSKRFPIAELRKRGVLPAGVTPGETVEKLAGLLGIGAPEAWDNWWPEQQAAFRASSKFKIKQESVACWLRLGELEAKSIDCAPYDRDGFMKALGEIRKLTREPIVDAIRKARDLCAGVGVAVVFIKRFPNVPLHGATRWMTPDKVLIQLSLRYKTNDQLWFTFFHEAAHILHHAKRAVYLNLNNSGYKEEEEANRAARDFLIPPAEYQRYLRASGRRFTRRAVVAFSRGLGIAPGIVVGRLQYDGHLPHTHLNSLKIKLDWAE